MSDKELENKTGDENFVAPITGYGKKISKHPAEEIDNTEIPEDVQGEVDDFNAQQERKLQAERKASDTKIEERKKDKKLDRKVQEQIDQGKQEKKRKDTEWDFRNP